MPVHLKEATVVDVTPRRPPSPPPENHEMVSVPSEDNLSNQDGYSTLGAAAPALKPLNEREANRLLRSTYSERSNVHIGFTVYSVSSVNPVEQSFDADIRIYCRWYDKLMASDPDILSLRSSGRLAVGTQLPRRDDGYFPDAVVKMIDMDLVAHTMPKYELANAKHVCKVSGSEFCYLSPNDEPGWVTLETRYRGTFQQNFNLIPFPFDVQELCVIVRMSAYSDRGRSFANFELKGAGLQQEVKSWIKLAEWTRYQPSCIFESDSRGRARCSIQMLLRRKPTYHVQNVMAVFGCITVCCFFGFAILPEGLEERLAVTTTCLLTAVAFKIVVAHDIPKVNYMTIMDTYISASLLFQFSTMIAMFVVALLLRFYVRKSDIDPVEFQDQADMICLGGFFLAFVLFHMWILRRIVYAQASADAVLAGLKTATDASDELRRALRKRAKSDYLATHQSLRYDDKHDGGLCGSTGSGLRVNLSDYPILAEDTSPDFTKKAKKGKADNSLSGSFTRNNARNQAMTLNDMQKISTKNVLSALKKPGSGRELVPKVARTKSQNTALADEGRGVQAGQSSCQ